MSKGIVTYNALGRYGRLANQMYQIASTIGVARRNGMQFAFPYWKNYDHAERFGSSEDIDVQKYFKNPLPIYNGPTLPDHFVHWGYHDVVLRGSTSLSGHMQSQRYFDHCLDEVRWYFRMKGEESLNDLCAIHVRMGDYDNQYHPRLGPEYYIPAMAKMPTGTRYILFSDEPDNALCMLRKGGFDGGIIISESDYMADFRAMKSCRHFIIGNSSYSAMAAVLGEAKDKIVVAPDPWFGPAHTNITGKDIYNHDWKIINWKKQIVIA